MPETSLSKVDYLNVLETWVYPRISGLSIDWMKEQGTDKGVFTIKIPKQPRESKPYIIRINYGDKPESKLTEIVFGFVERKLDSNRAHSIQEIHELLKLGMTFDQNIESQLQSIALRIDDLAFRSTPQATPAITSSINIRDIFPLLDQARDSAHLNHSRTLGVALMPSHPVNLTGWERRDSDLVRAMEHPPSLRPHIGWGLETGEQARLVAGKLWRVGIANTKTLELYRNGTVLFVGGIDKDFLAWHGVSQVTGKESYSINPLTLTEVLLNFSSFVLLAVDAMTPRPQTLKGYLKLTSMAPSGEPGTRLSPMYIGNQLGIITGDSRSAPEGEMAHEFTIAAGSLIPEKLAYTIAAEIYLWFGFDITQIPFLDQDLTGDYILNSSKIRGISSQGQQEN